MFKKIALTLILLLATTTFAASQDVNVVTVTGWSQENAYYGSLSVQVDNSQGITPITSIELYYPSSMSVGSVSGWGTFSTDACTVYTSTVPNMSALTCSLTQPIPAGTAALTMTFGWNLNNATLTQSDFLAGFNHQGAEQGTLALSATSSASTSYQPQVYVDGTAYPLTLGADSQDIKLYTGTHSVTAQPFVANGFIYVPDYNASPVIHANAVTTEAINFVQSGAVQLVPVNFTVSGLGVGDTANAMINDNGYNASTAVNNGSNSIQVPNSGTYVIQLQNSSQNELPTNGVITVVDGVAQGDTNVHYIPHDVYVVGYVDYGSAQTDLITQAAQNGYTMIVVAFANLAADQTINIANLNPNLFQDMSAARAYAAQHNIPLKIIISFGGAIHTSFVHPTTPAEMQTALTNMIAFAKKPDANSDAYFDGVDFDIEDHVADTDPIMIDTLAAGLKKAGLMVTAAPQLNNTAASSEYPIGEIKFVTTANYQDYDLANSHNDFDYLFPQEYNTSSACVTVANQTICEGAQNFGSASFPALVALLPAGSPTKIAMGEPANTYAATNTAGGGDNTSNIFGGVITSAGSTTVLQNLANDMKLINSQVNFGGVMCWAINSDATGGNYVNPSSPAYQTPWQFVQTVNGGL